MNMPAISLAAVRGRRQQTLDVAVEAERRGFTGIFCPSMGDCVALCQAIAQVTNEIEAALSNARAARALRDEFGSLAAFFWSFEPDDADRPTRFDESSLLTLAQTPASKAMAKALKARGFGFVGPTTAYAFMQSMGIVNDHAAHCDTRAVVERARARFRRPRVSGATRP